jgi:hypothetical protein
MTDWMAYVYQQKPMPNNFKGVQVEVYIVDSNGNYRQVGTTQTDENGYYTLTWKPDIPGDYRVYAQFAGNNGYWQSKAVTSFTVEQEGATPEPTQALIQSMADTYILPGIVAIIVAIAIGFAVTIMVLRKRP